MKIEIDPVVYSWCRNHVLSVFDPDAEFEFSIWCAEIDAMKEIDPRGSIRARGYQARWSRRLEGRGIQGRVP